MWNHATRRVRTGLAERNNERMFYMIPLSGLSVLPPAGASLTATLLVSAGRSMCGGCLRHLGQWSVACDAPADLIFSA